MKKVYIILFVLAVFIIGFINISFENEAAGKVLPTKIEVSNNNEKQNTDAKLNKLVYLSVDQEIRLNNKIISSTKRKYDIIFSEKKKTADRLKRKKLSLILEEIQKKNEQKDKENTDNNVKTTRRSLLTQIKEHKVRTGDTLWSIARKHKVDIDTLIGANNITNMNTIRPGETIKILPVKGILYKMGPGETISSISKNFNLSPRKIIASNQINNPASIRAGKMLVLPGVKPEMGYRDRLNKLFIKPVNTRISSYYGNRWGSRHEGLDFAISTGNNVRAAGSGRVVYSGWARGYGKTIIIQHQQGIKTLYAHNSKLLVNNGERVNRGELISKSGDTGRTTGPNMHFEVQVNGRPVDPLTYLR